ncbi:MAG: cation-translocating P-type ATPase [Rudaea sp.]
MNGHEGALSGALTSREAAARLARDGHNELPSAKPRAPWAIAWEVVREPMFLLLIGAAAIYLALGDRREALALVASVGVMIGITFYQERKTERALDALRDLASPRALVLRDGEWRTVAGREVVIGDVLRVKEGDRVPADARLESATGLMADESLLTGESVPVRKLAEVGAREWSRPGGDDLPFVYSGTLLTAGQGIARVVATGRHTEMGRIGKALASVEAEPSPLQRETRHAVLVFAAIGIALCVAVALLYRVARGDWLNGLLAGVTLAMANLPEEFPVVLTVFLALGAWRISQNGVLTRRAPAIETLGAARVLCVDKTGTLTQNRMEVRAFWTPSGPLPLEGPGDEERARLLEIAVLASEREPFDPMEQAFRRLAHARFPALDPRIAQAVPIQTYSLSSAQLSVARVHRMGDENAWTIAAKGAPEAIADACRLDPAAQGAMHDALTAMAHDGLRVLGIAAGTWPPAEGRYPPLPEAQRDLPLSLVGLIGLADPVRPGVPAAIAECDRAGIRTVMITGDHAGTARAIAAQAGIAHPDAIATGGEIEGMSERELAECAVRTDVFARVMPEHKLRLVLAYKANGDVVAMTGDGVNDAPALKAAHIGVAMGARGSDVAREAAALVLLRDDFASLVAAVRLGRRIYDNIRKAMSYIVAVHVPTAGMSLLPLLLDWPLLFYPLHIVFLEFVIDPACSIAFEAEAAEANVMRRPPRPASARLFDRWMLAASIGQGVLALVAVAVLYGSVLAAGASEASARTVGFAGVVLSNVALIIGNRSRDASVRAMLRPNAALWWVIGGALVALALVIYVPLLREIFRFAVPRPAELAAAVLPALVVLAGIVAGRALWHRRHA